MQMNAKEKPTLGQATAIAWKQWEEFRNGEMDVRTFTANVRAVAGFRETVMGKLQYGLAERSGEHDVFLI